jgi:uncharacterized protein (DUF427 family)
MVRAIWNGKVLAESEHTVKVEGNHYFPPQSIKKEFFKESRAHTICPWKGVASYFDIHVDGHVNRDAAWYYPELKEAARKIQGYVAFWHGVEVQEN